MPAVVALNEVDAAALDRVEYDHIGLAGVVRERGVDRRADLVDVVAVDRQHVEAERRPFVGERLEPHDVLRRAVYHAVVAVDEGDEVRQPVVGDGHARLPVGALVAFAVAEHAVGLIVLASYSRGKSGARRDGQTVAQRAGRGVHARDLVGVEVHAHLRAGEVEGLEQLLVLKAEVAEQRRVGDGRVALGEDEPVAVLPLRFVDADVHVLVVENGHDVEYRHTAPDVAAPRPVGGVERQPAQVVRLGFKPEPFFFFKSQNNSSFSLFYVC